MHVVRSNWILIGILLLHGCMLAIPAKSIAQSTLERMHQINPDMPAPLPIDENLVAANGIRKLVGQYITIYTDVRNRADIEELTSVFDKAVPQWCEYFGIDASRANGWRIQAMVMGDDQRFHAAKLIPEGTPTFLAGLQKGHEMWVYLQPGKYYTRHLLLHEGTHAFMQWFLGGMGAPWYTEGMAEMIGVHEWQNNELKLDFRLTNRKQAEYWGRIKIIRDDLAQDRAMTIDEVLQTPADSFREVRYYAWSWAACEFFSTHPATSEAFSQLQKIARENGDIFNRQFTKSIQPYRRQLELDWELFIDELDFGFEVDRAAMREIKIVSENQFELDSALGWQSTNVKVEANESIQIDARGRFVVAKVNEKDWHCEANGISIEYYRGKPLGQLLVGVAPFDSSVPQPKGLLQPQALPANGTVTMTSAGTLCFRINESPAKLDDNRGKLKVIVSKISQ